MPCGHVSEALSIRLDKADRLLDYTLEKQTCGAPVGQASLLLSELQGKSVDEITQLDLSQTQSIPTPSTKSFLYLKHFNALRHSLLAYTGCDDSSVFRLEHIGYSPEVTSIYGTLRVSIETKNIPGCTTKCAPSASDSDEPMVQLPTSTR